MVQGKINRGRHTDHPAGRHSIRTKQCPPPSSPMFFTGRMPFLLPNQQCQSTKNLQPRIIFWNHVLSWYIYFIVDTSFKKLTCISLNHTNQNHFHPFLFIEHFWFLLISLYWTFSSCTLFCYLHTSDRLVENSSDYTVNNNMYNCLKYNKLQIT